MNDQTDMENQRSSSEPEYTHKRLRTVGQLKKLLGLKYPSILTKGIEYTAVMLPGGQLITLWKTLQIKFFECCIQVLPEQELDDEQRLFFTSFADYFDRFLNAINITVSSYTIQTMEKISDLLSIFGSECLAGLAKFLMGRNHDEDVIYWFLKLGYTWAEIQGCMLYYHKDSSKYVTTKLDIPADPVAVNLSYLLPHLTSTQWQQLEKQVQSVGGTSLKLLFMDLVAQKLKYLTLLVKEDGKSESNTTLAESNIREASQYICSSKLQGKCTNLIDNGVYSFVTQHLQQHELGDGELVNVFVNQISSQSRKQARDVSMPFLNDAKFHCAIVLRTSDEILTRIIKAKILHKPLKKIRKEIFSRDKMEELLSEATLLDTPKSTAVLQVLLDLTNNLIQKVHQKQQALKTASLEDGVTVEFSDELILPYLTVLSNLPLEEYSRILATVIFLTTLNYLIVLTPYASHKLSDILSTLLRQSCADIVGNQYIFSVEWIALFRWMCSNVECFSTTSQRTIAMIIFQNVYISPRTIEEFQEEFQKLQKVKITSPLAPMLLNLLEFLTNNYNRKIKSKVESQVQNHIITLMRVSLKLLKKAQKCDVKDTTNSMTQYNVFRAAWISQEASYVVSASTDASVSMKPVLEYLIEIALNYLTSNAEVKMESQKDDELCCRYALAFLRAVCVAKEFPTGFILKLWKVYMETRCNELGIVGFSEIPMLTAKDIYLASTTEEFAEVTLLITTELETQTRTTQTRSDSENKLGSLALLLQELLDVDLSAEKKTIRRHAIENALYSILPMFSNWHDTASASTTTNLVLPFLQFLVNLTRRRSALCSTNALSLCLAGITSVPLNRILESKLYRKVFSLVGELFNSFTVHRIDVLSFRNHIYLQCFQTLVESLTMRADQKINLSDEDILDSKYCAHAIERICQSMKLGQEEFSRISPYCIAILIRQFELVTVYPAVKEPLLSGCFKLIDICDDHGIAQLNSMFTTGSREIFKAVYDVYKKFYHYTGKV